MQLERAGAVNQKSRHSLDVRRRRTVLARRRDRDDRHGSAHRDENLFGALVASEETELERARFDGLRYEARLAAVQIEFDLAAGADDLAVRRKRFWSHFLNVESDRADEDIPRRPFGGGGCAC